MSPGEGGIIGQTEEISRKHLQLWEQIEKWLKNEAKGVGATIILFVYEGVRDVVVAWKNKPQIIELGKDDPFDAITKISVLAAEKGEVVSSVITMNKEVNDLIAKIAKQHGVDVVFQEIELSDGTKGYLVGYAAKSREILEKFSSAIETNPVIQNWLLLNPREASNASERAVYQASQLKNVMKEYFTVLAQTPSEERERLKEIREKTMKKIKNKGILDYTNPFSSINEVELNAFLLLLANQFYSDIKPYTTVPWNWQSDTEKQQVHMKIDEYAQKGANYIAFSNSLSEAAELTDARRFITTLAKNNKGKVKNIEEAIDVAEKALQSVNINDYSKYMNIYRLTYQAYKEKTAELNKQFGEKKIPKDMQQLLEESTLNVFAGLVQNKNLQKEQLTLNNVYKLLDHDMQEQLDQQGPTRTPPGF